MKEDGDVGPCSCPVAAAERKLDRNMDIFMRSIRDSDNARNRAFVAIKVLPTCRVAVCLAWVQHCVGLPVWQELQILQMLQTAAGMSSDQSNLLPVQILPIS